MPDLRDLPRPQLCALLTALKMARADLGHQAALFNVPPDFLTRGLEQPIARVERELFSRDTAVDEDWLSREAANRAARRQQAITLRQEREGQLHYEAQLDEEEARARGLRSRRASAEVA
jgi:hypothetical protein